MPDTSAGTYVYCLVASARRPALARVPRGLRGLGRPRVLEASRGRWLVVADAPLDLFAGEAISGRLGDLDWVSRAAVAHEAVVEAFSAARAVLPMKLFTIFTSDARAVDHVRRAASATERLIARVAGQQEWGVRVLVDPRRAATVPARPAAGGAGYLMQKKAQRDARADAARRRAGLAGELFDRCVAAARDARRREPDDVKAGGGSLLLEAAFLVPRGRAARFRALVARGARELAAEGLRVVLTGPWPPYSFVKD
jgi:hypothetical protein